MRVSDSSTVNILSELLHSFLLRSSLRIEIEFVYLFVCFPPRVSKCKFLSPTEFVSDDPLNRTLIALLIESFCLELAEIV